MPTPPQNYGTIDWGNGNTTYGACLLSGTPESISTCNYVISVLVFSWLANIAIGFFNCFIFNVCGIGDWMDSLISVCIALWWAIGEWRALRARFLAAEGQPG